MLPLLLLAAAPVTIASSAGHVDFRYRWSAEAAAVPQLDRRFRAAAARELRELRSGVAEDRAMRRRTGSELADMRYSLAVSWQTAGQSRRLLSLEAATAGYTGGAHGNSGTAALLWDRRLGREVTIPQLTVSPNGWTGAIRQPFCILLDRERAQRRNEPVQRSEMFGNCPEWKELTVTPVDRNRNGRFDHVRVTADPYVAGPYAEGEYVISLPVTATMVARLRPEYRASFEAQPPVQ